MDEPSDLELLRGLRARRAAEREAAFAVLFRRHAQAGRDLAYRVLGDVGLADDVVQEVFLRLYRDGAAFQERAQFTSWLYRVVLNRAIDVRRRETRHRADRTGRAARGGVDGEEASPLDGVAARGGDPLEELDVADRANAVRVAIDSLSPKLAEVVVLRYPQDLSYEEIGEILGVPPGTVKSRLNRAHEALRTLLKDRLHDA